MEQVNDRISEIRSVEVQEVLTRVPGWMTRWGTTLIFGLIGLILVLSWIIKYPEIIRGNVMITTRIPPVKLVSKSSGQINKIYQKDGVTVKKGEFIAEIKSPIDLDAIEYLQNKSSEIESKLLYSKDREYKVRSTKRDTESLSPHDGMISRKNPNHIAFNDKDLVFGEIQPEYNNLKTLVQEYQFFLYDKFREKKLSNFEMQLNHNNRLVTISKHQLALAQKNLRNAKEKYLSDKKLYDNGAISKMSFYEKEKEYISYQQQVEDLNKTIVQYEVSITDYEKQLNDLSYEFSEKERTLIEKIMESMDKLKNFVHTWEQNYVLTAPFDGKLSYLSNLSEYQFIQAGTPLFAIIPNYNSYLGHIELPLQGAGKVEEGQKVHIKLNNYPYNEYGQVVGQVSEISSMPGINAQNNQQVYMVKVKLTNDLVTTYKKELKFKPEMSGTAEIITKDLSLLERIFNQLRKVFDK